MGLLGVELFFVLSGRLMAEILFIQKMPLPLFFWRRMARVYPALIIFVLTCWAVLGGLWISYKWKAALTALTFTYNYASLFKHAPALDHIWSLCVEEHGYVILAVLSVMAGRRGGWAMLLLPLMIAAAMMNGIISYLWLTGGYEQTYWRTDVHVASILMGAWIRLMFAHKKIPPLRNAGGVAGIAMALGMLMFMDAIPFPVKFTAGSFMLALAVNTLDRAAPSLRQGLSHPVMVSMGLCSFSIYLWQQPFYLFVYRDAAHPVWMAGGAVICGLISFYLIEGPIRRWLNQMDPRLWMTQIWPRIRLST